jgi:hypothetical protein
MSVWADVYVGVCLFVGKGVLRVRRLLAAYLGKNQRRAREAAQRVRTGGVSAVRAQCMLPGPSCSGVGALMALHN